ncbi:MAG: M3 family oligoendopeptidase, partial [Lachnospiraceae bacterium]
MKFSQMKYQRPNMDEVTKHLKKVKQDIENATSGEELVEIIKDYNNNFSKDLQTMSSLAHVRYTINTKDEFYDKENEFWDENNPIIEALSTDISRAIYKSKFRKDLVDAFGEFYIQLLECELTLDERAVPFMQKENELITKYSKIIANSKIEFRGKTYTYSQMAPLLQNTDRDFRKEAFEARNRFFEEHEEEFDQIYDEMVHLRHDMAKALGYDNYIELRYKMLKRVDYNFDDVSKYREKILKVFSPLAIKIRKKQAENLGIKDFKFYDRALDFKDGNSTPDGDYNFIVSNAQKMYRELSKETGEFFDFMVENELMDLLAKEGKRSGGYCTSFDKYKAPFIFSNFNGTNGDIDVITHEAGHAFQNYMSQDMILSDFIWPSYESCEIHSMSMEFLTWPWMNLFFGKNEDKFKYSALKGSISFLPYGVTVDHFQQFVYENPDATPEQRKA